jgi:2-deoxy-D-gluconate 3-dehydrogenase
MISFDLTGRVAMITGANAGIGRAVAIALAGAGADVVAVGRSSCEDTVRDVEALGRGAIFLKADLSTTAGGKGLVEAAVAELGQLDILVNNAGIIRRADAVDFTEADWDDVMDTNLKSLFFLSQAAGRHMLERGRGSIINIASLLSFQGGIRVASYTASKSGVAGLTKLLANEWSARGVNVNGIAPGYIRTSNTAPLQADADRNRAILERIPAGRWGEAEDIGGAAVFLASDAAKYVHGVVLPVDGGWLAR